MQMTFISIEEHSGSMATVRTHHYLEVEVNSSVQWFGPFSICFPTSSQFKGWFLMKLPKEIEKRELTWNTASSKLSLEDSWIPFVKLQILFHQNLDTLARLTIWNLFKSAILYKVTWRIKSYLFRCFCPQHQNTKTFPRNKLYGAKKDWVLRPQE